MTDYSIDFNFGGADTMYLTHSLHPYPSKFPPQLPNVILSKYGIAEHNDVTTRETPFSYTISGIPEEIVVTYKLAETK